MVISVVELLFTPGKFFSHTDREERSLAVPAIIVVLPAVIGVIFNLSLFTVPNPLVLLISVESLIVALIVPVVIWGMYSAFFYYLGRKVSGSGPFEQVMEYTGYGMLPGTLLAILSLLLSAFLMHFPEIYTDIAGPNAHELLWFLGVEEIIISVIALLWNGYLWVYGIAAAHAIPVLSAVKVIAPAIFLTLLWIFWPPLLMLLMGMK